MYTNVNLAAPIEALALLGTGCILFIAAVILGQSLAVRKTGRAKVVFGVMVLIVAAYFSAMLIFSLISHDKLLARGEEKHFCELDCHLAYSLVSAAPASLIGEGANQVRAQGQFTVLTIKTRFDETTIGPQRGNSLLYPNDRVFVLIDESGSRYSPAAQSGTPVTTPLRPGESYTTDVAFDMPLDRKASVLILKESAWETRLLIGHENSLQHGQTKFQI
jgi:hypothetical protein